MYEHYELYLMHHGIKGMHWGVRRSPEELGYRAYQKTAKKLRSYGKAIERNQQRAARYAYKSSKYKVKAQKAWSDEGFTRKSRKAAKLELKANRANMRAKRFEAKGQNKAKKLVSKYKDLPASDINPDDLAYVNRWINKSWT